MSAQIRVELVEDNEVQRQRPAINNLKLGLLIMFTFGLIVGIYALSNKIEQMKGPKAVSYQASGAVIFGLFIVYVIAFGVAWYCGSGKRQVMKREAVQKQIAREKAIQALKHME